MEERDGEENKSHIHTKTRENNAILKLSMLAAQTMRHSISANNIVRVTPAICMTSFLFVISA